MCRISPLTPLSMQFADKLINALVAHELKIDVALGLTDRFQNELGVRSWEDLRLVEMKHLDSMYPKA